MTGTAFSSADGRYAPTPSGPLHLGNLRTALAAWLFARSQGAAFRLRIDDLDSERSRAEHAAAQLEDLRRLGLDWDGEPMRPSERRGAHSEAFEMLRSRGLLYPCWCTRAEIRQAASAPHGPLPEGAYPGTCRRLTGRERSQRERSGRPPAWRLAGDGETISFQDRLHGEVRGVVDDFVVWRGAGAAYNFAVVLDDAAQGVGEVVRGEDLLDATPRQVLLARHLGLDAPCYAHVPLVLGPDGARLAKRHGAVTLRERLAQGETVEQVVGWMASTLGLAADGARVRAADLVDGFDPATIRLEPTVLAPA